MTLSVQTTAGGRKCRANVGLVAGARWPSRCRPSSECHGWRHRDAGVSKKLSTFVYYSIAVALQRHYMYCNTCTLFARGARHSTH